MDIRLDQPEWALDSPVMTKNLSCTIITEMTTMHGEIRRQARRMSIAVPNDRESLPLALTLRDVVLLAVKRLHPVLQYVAEQNGIRVHYLEQWALHQVLGCIEYGPNGRAIRIVL